MGATCCNNSTVLNSPIIQSPFSAQQEIEKFEQKHPQIAEVIKQLHLKPFFNDPERQQDVIVANELETIYVGFVASSPQNSYFGIMMYPENGFFYVGMWKNNKKSGRGCLIHSNGDYYNGNWVQEEPQGEGIYVGKQQKIKYEGRWLKGKQHGYGTENYLEDRSKYEGEFADNKKHGNGKMTFSDGSFFQGIFVNDRFQGQGKYVRTDMKYEGQFKNGIIEGTGKSYWLDAESQPTETYIGQYQKGQKHGFGQYRWNKTKVYKGHWKHGHMQNEGVMISNEDQESRKEQNHQAHFLLDEQANSQKEQSRISQK